MTDVSNVPTPADEVERLEALKRYEILDTPPEKSFDRLTKMATRIFDVPIALVSLIDEDRQWWKSCVGVDRRQTDRELAFCNVPVKTKNTTVIPDATKDERFKDNSLVTGKMNIRFYAGVPLLTDDNHALGTLCVIDTKPRDFSEDQIEILEGLAKETFSQLELRRNRNQIQKQARELKMLENAISSVREGITVSDPSLQDNPVIYVNDAFEDITGYAREDVLGNNCRMLQGDDTDPDKVKKMRNAIQEEESVTVRLKNYKKNGEPFWNMVSVTPVHDEDGEVTHFVGVQQDVTEYKEVEEALEYQAQYDDLTGLLNRKTLIQRFEAEIERVNRYDAPLSFVIMDLDHFKTINDDHGHQTGDKVLQKVGRLIEDHVRNSDIAGRYGGEEFAIVLPETDLDRAKQFAERLRLALKESTFETMDGNPLVVTASAGVSQLTEDETSSDILERADKALYEAKDKGRDQVIGAT